MLLESLETYLTTRPLQDWLDRHWKYVMQSVQSELWRLRLLIDRSRGKSMNKFLNRFDKHDYVKNDHKVGHR